MGTYRTFILDGQNRVRSSSIEKLKDPTPYRPDEAQFEADVPPRSNPKRYDPSKLAPVVGTHEEIDPITGEPYTVTDYALWTDCIQRSAYADLEAMTDPEKAQRDADYAAEEDAKEHAAQDAKPQALKDREKKFKDLGTELGVTFPIAKGSLDATIDALMAQIEQDLVDNKDKDAIRKLYKCVSMLAIRNELGDDVYSKYIGDGGQ